MVRPDTQNPGMHLVRATFQRTAWDTQGAITKRETLNGPEAYEEFFARLSKALFLEEARI